MWKELYGLFRKKAFETNTDIQPWVHRAVEVGAPLVLALKNPTDEIGEALGQIGEQATAKESPKKLAETGETSSSIVGVTPEIAQWARIFSDVLASGHVVAIEAVLQNVIAFDLLIHRDPKGRDEHYTVPSPADWRAGAIAKILEEFDVTAGSGEKGKRIRADARGTRRGA
jgi:hypothetical protein